MGLYYECHVTIEPVFDGRRVTAVELAKVERFKLAELLMKKRAADLEERSDKDTFMTGHSHDIDDLRARMRRLVAALQEAGFKVWRYKIEDCVVDSRMKDSEVLLA